MKVGLDDVAAEAGETPSTSRRNDEPTSTPDRLPGAPIFGTAEPREGSRVAPRFERFGARTRGALVDSASRRGWLAPWPSGRGGRPAARAARETPSAGNPGGGRGTESLAHLFGGASAATRRVPARSSSERDLGGDQKPMEDRASRDQQWCRRRYGLGDGAKSRSRPSLAIPPKRRQRRFGARASAPIGNVGFCA